MWMKRLIAATAAIAMLSAFGGCGSKDTDTLSDNQFVVDLMQHFRLMDIRMIMANMSALTWIWQRKSVTATTGNW